MLDLFHKNFLEYKDELDEWFLRNSKETQLPIYGSVDIRYSGWKVSVVDANYFPAGFNNLSDDLTLELSNSLKKYLNSKYDNISHIHLLPESHTRNPGYVENLLRIKEIIETAGFKVTIGSSELNGYSLLEGITEDIALHKVSINEENFLQIEGVSPDLILLNNDLTGGLIPGLSGIVEPNIEMGWHKRRKSNHYYHLEKLVDEVSNILKLDPWYLMPMWFVSEGKCLELESCTNKLADEIDLMIEKIKIKYDTLGIDLEPVIFIKNDGGTYGLGIISITSGEEIKHLSKRKIKRLTYGKGGSSAENFLIQEGIPTSLIDDGSVMEPVGYTIGGKEPFWFFRSNTEKNEFSNLNSPSSEFLQPNNINQDFLDSKYLDWFNLVSRLSFIAMGKESI